MKKLIFIIISTIAVGYVNGQCLIGSVSGGGTSCTGQSFEIILTSSLGQLDTEVQYKLYRGSTLVSSVWGFDSNDQPRTNIIWNQSIQGTYTVRANGNGCSNTLMDGSAVISAGISSVVSISPNSDPGKVCNPASFVLTASGGSGYRWYRQGTPLDSSPTGATFSPDSPGTYYATGVNNCGVTQTSDPISVSFLSVSTPVISGTSSRCRGTGTSTYAASADNVNNYVWSISAGSSSISSAGVVTWEGSFSGTAVISVTANGCAGSSKSSQYSVSVTPWVSTPTLSGSLSRCIGSGSSSYTASASNASGYSWAVNGVGNTISPSGVVTWGAYFSGTAQVTVTAQGCNGSTASQSVNVDVFTIPLANVSGTAAACSGTTFPISLNPVSGTTLDPNSVYTLYKDGISTNISVPGYNSSDQPRSGGVLWNVTTSGTYTVWASRSGCANVLMESSAVISTTSSSAISISPNSDPSKVCNPASFVLTASGGSGYRWYRQGTPLDSSPTGATFSPDSPGTYYATGVNNCGVTQTSDPIAVSFLSVSTPVISGATARCRGTGTSTFTASAQNVNNYVWSISAGSSSISSAGVVTWDGSFSGTAVISVTANGCAGSSKSTNFNVIVYPTPLVSSALGPIPICTSVAINYSPSSNVSGAIFTWSRVAVLGITEAANSGYGIINETLTNTTTNAINVNYSVSASANGCNGPSSIVIITIKPKPSITSSLSPPAICSDLTFSYTPTSSISGSSFNWSRAAVSGISQLTKSGVGTINEVLTNTTTTSKNVTYLLYATANGCPGPLSTMVVNIKPKPVLTSSLNPAGICSGSAFSYTPTSSVTGSSFNWSRAAVAGITEPTKSGTLNINEILTNTSTNSLVVAYKIYPTASSCVGATSTVTVTVKPKPVITSALAQGSICSGTTFSYDPTSSISGSTFNWSRAAVPGVNEPLSSGTARISEILTNNSNVPVNVTYTVFATSNACASVSVPVVVAVNPTPTLSSSRNVGVITSGSLFTYTPTSTTTGATFTWSRVLVTGIIQQATEGTGNVNEVLTNTTSNPIDVTYLFSGTANGCAGPTASVIVKVNPIPNNYNYIITRDIQSDKKADGSAITTEDVASLPVGFGSESTTYFDGLGRPMQSVSTQASPNKLDIVTPVVYDAFGRERFKFLPIATGSDGRYKPNETMVDPVNGGYINSAASFYGQANSTIASDPRPFSETLFEPSPLNRPAKQFGPGVAWNDTSDPNNRIEKPVTHDYLVNALNEVYLFGYDVTTGLITWAGANSAAGFYDAGQLYANKTTDEQGHEVIEYVDKEGRTVCKKVEASGSGGSKVYASTYYIYDDLGNLAVVLPPEGVVALTK